MFSANASLAATPFGRKMDQSPAEKLKPRD